MKRPLDDCASLPEAEAAAHVIAERIKPDVPHGWGFLLLLSTYGTSGYSTYLSSIRREDAKVLLLEFLEEIGGGPEVGELGRLRSFARFVAHVAGHADPDDLTAGVVREALEKHGLGCLIEEERREEPT